MEYYVRLRIRHLKEICDFREIQSSENAGDLKQIRHTYVARGKYFAVQFNSDQ